MLLFKINKKLSLVFKRIIYKIPELFLMASALTSVSCDAADSTILTRNDVRNLNLTPDTQNLTPKIATPFLLEQGTTGQLNDKTSLDIRTSKKCPPSTTATLVSSISQTEENKYCAALGLINTAQFDKTTSINNYHIIGIIYMKTAKVCPSNSWIQLNWQVWCQ